MQIVNVLRDQSEVFGLGFECGKGTVCSVWLNFKQLTTPGLIKSPNENGVCNPCLRRSNVFDAVFFPQTITITIRANSRFGRNACTRQDHHSLLCHGGQSLRLYLKVKSSFKADLIQCAAAAEGRIVKRTVRCKSDGEGGSKIRCKPRCFRSPHL